LGWVVPSVAGESVAKERRQAAKANNHAIHPGSKNDTRRSCGIFKTSFTSESPTSKYQGGCTAADENLIVGLKFLKNAGITGYLWAAPSPIKNAGPRAERGFQGRTPTIHSKASRHWRVGLKKGEKQSRLTDAPQGNLLNRAGRKKFARCSNKK